MDIPLIPEHERLIQNCVESGRYHSAGEVVREALRLLEESEELDRMRLTGMREKIAAGLTSLDQGEGVAGEAAFDELDAGVDVPHGDHR
jgi:antitoxin ParD1/3/4